MREIFFEVKQKIATLSEDDSEYAKELNFISWNGGEPRLDIRMWKRQQDGTQRPLKGIALTDSEVQKLKTALESWKS